MDALPPAGEARTRTSSSSDWAAASESARRGASDLVDEEGRGDAAGVAGWRGREDEEATRRGRVVRRGEDLGGEVVGGFLVRGFLAGVRIG